MFEKNQKHFQQHRRETMNYNITSRHIDLTESMKDAVDHALEHSERIHDKIIDADVILSSEHHNFIAEAVVHIPGQTVFVKSEKDNMYSAITTMGEKLVHALQKVIGKKTKIKHKKLVDEI